MALYQLQGASFGAPAGSIRRTTDGAIIPLDPGNRDFQDFLAWQAAGNAPDPVAPSSADLATKDNTFGGDPWAALGGPI